MPGDVRCYHSHPPFPAPRELDVGTRVSAVVVCIHVFGVGVWLPDLARFGHVNASHMGVAQTQTLDDYPRIGEALPALVLGYAGARRQLRLQVVEFGP